MIATAAIDTSLGGARRQGSSAMAVAVFGVRRWVAAITASLVAVSAFGQLDGSMVSIEHPAIEYRTAPPANPIADLQQRIERGVVELSYDPRPGIGYLPALLRELGVPVESQLLIYS
jgi:hypothetical protein